MAGFPRLFQISDFMEQEDIFSPFKKYCYEMDKKLRDKSYYDYYDYIEAVYLKNPGYGASLFLSDVKYRHKHQLNVLAELYGQQGCGKSLFGQDLAYRVSDTFEQPFDAINHTLVDFDDLEKKLHDAPFRTTFIVDEQPKSFFGYGSSRVTKSLRDFEEICRYTMKNILWIAPSERAHSSYYVFKEGDVESVERTQNPECLNCPKQSKCLKIFEKNKYETLCSMEFYHRHGYPKAFVFQLQTERKSDGHYCPRAYVRLPMLPPKLDKKYDSIKQSNISVFESRKTIGWSETRRKLKDFQKKYKAVLIRENGKPAPKELIKAYLMDHFGGRAFTVSEMDIMVAVVRAEILSPDFAEKSIKEMEIKD